MPLKVAKNEKKKNIFLEIKEISSTKQMKYGSSVLCKYGHLSVKIRKKYDDYKDFFVSALVGHFAELPI